MEKERAAGGIIAVPQRAGSLRRLHAIIVMTLKSWRVFFLQPPFFFFFQVKNIGVFYHFEVEYR